MHLDTETLFTGAMLLVSLLFVSAGLILAIFYLLTLQRCLTRVSPANRAMSPGMVSLNLIPLFNLVWMFVTVLRIAESVVKEGQARGIAVEDGGKTLGLVYAILVLCCFIPLLNFLCSVGALVCWILYWIKISGYSSRLARPPTAPAAPVLTT